MISHYFPFLRRIIIFFNRLLKKIFFLIHATQANPPQLHSNLLYIQRYRRQSRLVSESAYFFTNILSAESFIWNIDANSLSMEEDEFQRCMESARAVLSGLTSDLVNEAAPVNREASAQERTRSRARKEEERSRVSVSDLVKKGAVDLLKEDQVNGYFQEYPFLYARAGDLTVPDVESLLSSYKQLVLKYVSLSKAMHITNPSIPLLLTQGKDSESKKEGESLEKTSTPEAEVPGAGSSSEDPFVEQSVGKE